MHPRRILVTGSAGAVGRTVSKALVERGHHVRGFDLRAGPHGHEHHVGSVTDAAAISAAMAGCDTVVHLAATPDIADFTTLLVPNNIVGTYHVLEAAKEAKVRRVVMASSIRATTGVRKDGTITIADGAHASDLYGVTKVAGEAMAEVYAARHGLSIICVRLGWFVRDPREAGMMNKSLAEKPAGWAHPIYLSHDDCARFHLAAVENEAVGFAILFAISDNGGTRRYDLEPSERILGWVPRDSWPNGTPAEVIAPARAPAQSG
ncbi:MAG: NAD(P)-dependent oxidoreductase [Planctomycetes bacterium]|nr:NAD(P)-dependent oxidoreductase [Planctomycetota bacterium]